MTVLYEIEKPEPKKNKTPKNNGYRAPRETQSKSSARAQAKKSLSTTGLTEPSHSITVPSVSGGLRIWVE